MIVLPEGTMFGGGVPETNVTAASQGTTVTASSTANSKGSWVSLIDPTSGPSYGICVRVQEVHASATVANLLLDIGYGPTGGGNEVVLLPDLGCGAAADHTTAIGGKDFFFPVYVPAGVRVSARAAASTASDTALVQIHLLKRSLWPVRGGPVSAYGVVAASSRGTSITPGTNAFGSWTLLQAGPLNRPHTLWYCAMDGQADTTMIDNRHHLVQLGIGPDSSNVTPIFQGHGTEEGSECVDAIIPVMPQYAPTIADAAIDLWCRIAATPSAEARGMIAYGMD